MLETARTVILDEIHAVVADKRGSHLSLSIERLEQLTRISDFGIRNSDFVLTMTRPLDMRIKFHKIKINFLNTKSEIRIPKSEIACSHRPLRYSTPIEEVARFLVGSANIDSAGNPNCAIIDSGHTRKLDLAIELPESPLQAVMSGEVGMKSTIDWPN
jgi:ATP-dependent Lhr-like helicase